MIQLKVDRNTGAVEEIVLVNSKRDDINRFPVKNDVSIYNRLKNITIGIKAKVILMILLAILIVATKKYYNVPDGLLSFLIISYILTGAICYWHHVDGCSFKVTQEKKKKLEEQDIIWFYIKRDNYIVFYVGLTENYVNVIATEAYDCSSDLFKYTDYDNDSLYYSNCEKYIYTRTGFHKTINFIEDRIRKCRRLNYEIDINNINKSINAMINFAKVFCYERK